MRWISCVVLMTFAGPVLAQTQQKAPTQYDVVTVKPAKAGETSSYWRWTSDGFEAHNMYVKMMLAGSYNVKSWLVFGLPAWAESTGWDMQAKVLDADTKPIEKLTPQERNTLMLSLLRDRFGLVAHTESKVQPVFVMTTLPEGIKLKASPAPPAGEPEPKFGRTTYAMNTGKLEGKYVTMKQLADVLSGEVERTIVDKSGVTGDYDVNLKWTPERRINAGDNGTAGETAPSIYEALKEQAGLKLTADKAPVPTVIVDKLVQPEAN
ncbi:MAG TPA: TIGR03435 family protein [Terriglobus sp.]